MWKWTTYLLDVRRYFELTCVRQITAMLTKSFKAQGALKSLLAHHSHLPISTTLLLYRSFIRSAMTYSSVVRGAISETKMQTSNFAKVFIARMCTRTTFIRNVVIDADLIIKPASHVIQELSQNLPSHRIWYKTKRFDPPELQESIAVEVIKDRILSWAEMTFFATP